MKVNTKELKESLNKGEVLKVEKALKSLSLEDILNILPVYIEKKLKIYTFVLSLEHKEIYYELDCGDYTDDILKSSIKESILVSAQQVLKELVKQIATKEIKVF